jgi:PIN domain nuclease of toxin-antitoxin system
MSHLRTSKITWNEAPFGHSCLSLVLRGSASVSAAARAAIEDPGNEKYVSHATAWEVAIKASLGKLKLAVGYDELLPGALLANGFLALPPNFRHYGELLTLPFHHRDPFDRCLLHRQVWRA